MLFKKVDDDINMYYMNAHAGKSENLLWLCQ